MEQQNRQLNRVRSFAREQAFFFIRDEIMVCSLSFIIALCAKVLPLSILEDWELSA